MGSKAQKHSRALHSNQPKLLRGLAPAGQGLVRGLPGDKVQRQWLSESFRPSDEECLRKALNASEHGAQDLQSWFPPEASSEQISV